MSTSDIIPVRIITHNVFQMPWLVSAWCKYIKRDSEGNCVGQVERADRLCKLLPQFDICLLQEMWGSNIDSIKEKLEPNYDFPEELVEHIREGRMADYKNAWLTSGKQTGGLFVAIRNDIPIIWYRHHVFENNKDEESSFKSVGFTLLNMHQYWRGKYLLVINVHLNGSNPHEISDTRQLQRMEIKKELIKIHKEENYPLGFKWTDCGVIIAGDFNTAAINFNNGNTAAEYTQMLIDLGSDISPYGGYSTDGRARDLFKEHHYSDRHSETFNVSRNKYADNANIMQACRMDYILALDSIAVGDNKYTPVMKLTASSCEIVEQDQGDETSDHYPVVSVITPANNADEQVLNRPPPQNPAYTEYTTGKFDGYSSVGAGGFARYTPKSKKYF